MPANLVLLRSQIEHSLASRVPAPFDYHDRSVTENASTGIREIDLLTGGFPRGALTEIVGPSGSGRTSLFISALRMRASQGEDCALIDASDAFSPFHAKSAGMNLNQLLWVRCHSIHQAFRAADLILQGGGFGLVCLDLSDISHEVARKIPLETWFRFRRAVENTRTILLLLEQTCNAKTCASLVLKLAPGPIHWSATKSSDRKSKMDDTHFLQSSFTQFFQDMEVHAQVVRSRTKPVATLEFRDHRISVPKNSGMNMRETIFSAKSIGHFNFTRSRSEQNRNSNSGKTAKFR